MALQTNGYVRLLSSQYNTYDDYRNYCLTHGINVDFSAGNQCWDSLALLWYQYGRYLVTRPSGNGSAYMCWTISKKINAQPPFIAVEGVQNIKRGDILVFNKSSWSNHGHICLADADYSQRVYERGAWRLPCVGQNQGQGISSGTPSNIVKQNLSSFLGIFRNTNWTTTPPTPPTPEMGYNKDKYNFVLFNRRKRQDKWTKKPLKKKLKR